MAEGAIQKRKQSHLDLCAREEVEYPGKTTLFEDVELFHDALSDLDMDAIDPSVELVGKKLQAPLLITGMTGGTPEAAKVNRDLAALAERHGIGFGLGSQRAMVREPRLAVTYRVRDVAPTVPVLANLGLTQAASMSSDEVESLADSVGADAVCIHLNIAQELIQPEGDRHFSGGSAALGRLATELRRPVIAKETGCGLSRRVADRLQRLGIGMVDVSGAGGTSWVRVERLRGDARSEALGELFRDWGIPTAASLLQLQGSDLFRIASGGIRDPLDVLKAIALGANLCGFALPVYRAYRAGGSEDASEYLERTLQGLKVGMLLTGSRTISELREQPVVLGPRLREWAHSRGRE